MNLTLLLMRLLLRMADRASAWMTPVHIEVDDKGMTRAMTGVANAQACLRPNEEAFRQFWMMQRLLQQRHSVGNWACLAR